MDPMAQVPMNPRQTWAMGRATFRPVFRSPRMASQPMITGRAKNDRKNTDSPAGTSLDTHFTSDCMTMKHITAISL